MKAVWSQVTLCFKQPLNETCPLHINGHSNARHLEEVHKNLLQEHVCEILDAWALPAN